MAAALLNSSTGFLVVDATVFEGQNLSGNQNFVDIPQFMAEI